MDISDKGLITAPEIIAGGEWFNPPAGGQVPLAINNLKGKVVLIDFWTYTCINCIRTLPYIQDWHEKYSDDGLVIIGVHTPEFEFEKSPANVAKAISDFGLTYPIVQDNDFETWRAYDNHYWPAKYLIDHSGKIIYTHFGEGDYDKTEMVIQEALKKAGFSADKEIKNPSYKLESRTSELYLGYERMGYFATPDQLKPGVVSEYILPNELAINHFALSGKWKIENEYSQAFEGSSLILGYQAKNVFLVMRPKNDQVGNVRVFLDDREIKTVKVDGDKLYTLIEEDISGIHTLKLEFEDENVEIYAFTFG